MTCCSWQWLLWVCYWLCRVLLHQVCSIEWWSRDWLIMREEHVNLACVCNKHTSIEKCVYWMNVLTHTKYVCRIMVKTTSKTVIQRMGSFLNPLYGMLLGAKAAAHSAMLHFKHFPHDRVLINLHFNKNGLTTDIIRRSCITLFNSCLMPMCIHPSHLNTSHQSSAFVLKPVNHYSHYPVHSWQGSRAKTSSEPSPSIPHLLPAWFN